MTLRDALLPVFNEVARQIPVNLGLRTSVVKLRTRTWSGGQIKLGTALVVDTTITPAPKTRKDGPEGTDLKVGPITPQYAGGGYTPAQLNPSTTGGVEFYYAITKPDGTERAYKLRDIDTARTFGYYLKLEPLDRAAPF